MITHDRRELRRLGEVLVRAGVTERALRVCFGLGPVAHLPRALPHRADPGPKPHPRALPLWLFCAGRAIAFDAARAVFAEELDHLIDAGLLVRDGNHVVATCALIPMGRRTIAACDRLDDASDDAVLWPDDSSHHLIGALPRGHVVRWLDVGTGSGLAPLMAPNLAHHGLATDLSPNAIRHARTGSALSDVLFNTVVADLLAGAGDRWDLISFNAPIPAEAPGATEAGEPIHRRAPMGARILERFWAEVPALVRDGAEVVVHSFVPADPLAPLAHLPGAVVIARYATDPGFAVTWWQPSAPARREVVDITLTVDAPHVTRAAL